MKKRYILNGKIYYEQDLTPFAEENGMSFEDYIKESGAQEHIDENVYIFNDKEYKSDVLADFAKENDMPYEDYLKEIGAKKKDLQTQSTDTSKGLQGTESASITSTTPQPPSEKKPTYNLKEDAKQRGLNDEESNKVVEEFGGLPEGWNNYVTTDIIGNTLNKKKTDPLGYRKSLNDMYIQVALNKKDNKLSKEFGDIYYRGTSAEPTAFVGTDNKLGEDPNPDTNITSYEKSIQDAAGFIDRNLSGEEKEKALTKLYENQEIDNENRLSDEYSVKNVLRHKLLGRDLEMNLSQDEKNKFTIENYGGKDVDNYTIESLELAADPNDKLAQSALKKYKIYKGLEKVSENQVRIDDIAVEFMAEANGLGDLYRKSKENGMELPDVTKGELMNAFLNDPIVIEKATTDPNFRNLYERAAEELNINYPDYAQKRVATIIAQAREDKGYNNPLANIPTEGATDELVSELVKEGKLTEFDKQIYQNKIRPNVGVGNYVFGLTLPGMMGGKEPAIPTQDLVSGLRTGIKSGLTGALKGFETLVTAPIDMGTEIFSSDSKVNRVKKKMQIVESLDMLGKNTQNVVINANAVNAGFDAAGNFTGFALPLMFGAGALEGLGVAGAAAHNISAGLIFTGINSEKAKMEFPDDPLKRNAYIAVSTWLDMSITKVLPLDKVRGSVSSMMSKDIKAIVNDLSTNRISLSGAKSRLDNIAVDYGKKLIGQNLNTAAVLTGLGQYHKYIDAIFGVKNAQDTGDAVDILKEFKSSFLSGTILSAVGAVGQTRGSNKLIANNLLEMSYMPETYRAEIQRQMQLHPERRDQLAEQLSNLNTLVETRQGIEESDLTPAQKEKYILNAIQAKVFTDMALKSTDPNVCQEYEAKAQQKRKDNEKIFKGEDKADEYKSFVPLETTQEEFPEIKQTIDYLNSIIAKGGEEAGKAQLDLELIQKDPVAYYTKLKEEYISSVEGTEVTQEQKENTIKAYDDLIEKSKTYGKENKSGVSGEVGVGEEPIQAKPDEGTGGEAVTAGGVLQAPEPGGKGKAAGTEEEVAGEAMPSQIGGYEVVEEMETLPTGEKVFKVIDENGEERFLTADGKELKTAKVKIEEKEPAQTGVSTEAAAELPKQEGAKPTEILKEPTQEQIEDDLRNKRFATFTYENESQVPEQFKGKISSRGEINGKPFVKVTLPKSVADYELSKQQGAKPTEAVPDIEAKKADVEKRRQEEINTTNPESDLKDAEKYLAGLESTPEKRERNKAKIASLKVFIDFLKNSKNIGEVWDKYTEYEKNRPTDEQTPELNNLMNTTLAEINAKYDVELKTLEKAKPTEAKAELPKQEPAKPKAEQPTAKQAAPQLGDSVEIDSLTPGGKKTKMVYTQTGWKIQDGTTKISASASQQERAQKKFDSENEVTEPKEDILEEQPVYVRNANILITPATIRKFDNLTAKIQELSLKYDALVKDMLKNPTKKKAKELENLSRAILDAAKQEIVDAASKIKGLEVKFGEDFTGLWDGKFEPSLNVEVKLSADVDTQAASDFLNDFAEKYSQDAFIVELNSEMGDAAVKKGEMLLTHSDGTYMHYPQAVVNFKEPLTPKERTKLSNSLKEKGITAYSLNDNSLKISIFTEIPEEQLEQFPEDQKQEEENKLKQKEYEIQQENIRTSLFESVGRTKKMDIRVQHRKSIYRGGKKTGEGEQQREYDRSDFLKPIAEEVKKTQELAKEAAALRNKEIKLQEQGKQLSPAEKKRLDELSEKVLPVIEETIAGKKTQYEEAKKELESIADKVMSGISGFVSKFPIKRPSRASVKVFRWYSGITEKLGDAVRVNIIVPSEKEANYVFNKINKEYRKGDPELRGINDPTELGYPKRLIEVKLSNGTIGEIQVMTPEGYLAKDGVSGFTENKEVAKETLAKVRERLGWDIPDGVGHYLYEIERDSNVPDSLRAKAKELSNKYYEAFLDPKSKLTDAEFKKDISEFKKEVDAADKSTWDKGNEGKSPETLNEYLGKEEKPLTTESKKQSEALAKKIRSLKIGGGKAFSTIDLGITKTLYDSALEFLASQVEKGTKFGKAVEATIDYIDSKLNGKKWDKDLFKKQAISSVTESLVVPGEKQPAMVLTGKLKGEDITKYSGETSSEALRKNSPDTYINRAFELSNTHLVQGKTRKYNKSWSNEAKLKWADEIYNKAKETVKKNLLFIYNNIPENVRTISKLWYDGANKISQEFAKKYNFTNEQSAAVIATLSPQKPWFDNLHLAQFMMEFNAKNQDMVLTQEAYDYYKKTGEAYPKQVEYLPELKKQIGKKYSELSDYDKSVMIRYEFDNNYDRKAPLRLPTGHIIGKVKDRSSFSGYDKMSDAISIMKDGSAENISANIGADSKVRNFYNNIVDPKSANHATIDTHAIAAGYLLPLGSKDAQVKFDFGTYSFFFEAYKDAAKEAGILPREMQSIVWEGVKSLFPPETKTEKNKKSTIELWEKYKNGEISLIDVQNKIKENGKDLSITDWSGFIDKSIAEGETGGYVEELSRTSGDRPTAGERAGGGTKGEVSGLGKSDRRVGGEPIGEGGVAEPSINPIDSEKGIDNKDFQNYDGMFSKEKASSPFLTDLLNDEVNGKRGYQLFYKRRKASIEMMSPDEYLKRVAEGQKTTAEAQKGMISQERKDIVKAGIDKGNKIDMPSLSYDSKGNFDTQEGRHRATIAKERGEKLIPVVIERGATENDLINKANEIVNEANKDLKSNDIDEVINYAADKFDLHRDAVAYLKDNVSELKLEVPQQKTGKSAADKIRKGKIKLADGTLQSNIAGVPIALYNSVVEAIALSVEGGMMIKDAVAKAIREYKLREVKGFNKEEFVSKFSEAVGEDIKIEENPFESVPKTQAARDKYFEETFGDQADKAKEVYNKYKESGDVDLMMQEMGGGEGVPPTIDKKNNVSGNADAIRGITMAANEERRKDFGMGERQPSPESFEQWDAEAAKLVEEGYDMEALIKRMENGIPSTPVENSIKKIYQATLDAQIKENPTNELLAKAKRFIEATEVSSSQAGKNLVSLKGNSEPLSSITDFYIAKMEANGVSELTEEQKKEVQKHFEMVDSANKIYEKKLAEAEAKNAELLAQNELLKKQAESKSTQKPATGGKRDFKSERESIKEKLRKEVENYKASMNKLGISPDGGAEGFAISVKMAKLILELAKNHVEEVGTKLAEVTAKTFEDVKDIFPGITNKDIHDVIAGKYSEKKQTRSQIAADLKELETEAKLLNELDRVLAGEPKTEKERIKKNQRLEEIRKRIKSIKKENKLDEYSDEARIAKSEEALEKSIKELERKLDENDIEVKEAEKLKSPKLEQLRKRQEELNKELKQRRKEAEEPTEPKDLDEARIKRTIEANKKKQAQLEKKLADKDFEPEEKPVSVYDNPEFKTKYPQLHQELMDSYRAKQDALHEYELGVLEDQMKRRSKTQKTFDFMEAAINTTKKVVTGIDDSAIFMQTLVSMVVRPVTGAKAFAAHLRDFASKKSFERSLDELHNSKWWGLIEQSGLNVSEPQSLVEAKHEEAFSGKTLDIKLKIKGEEYGIVKELTAPFERAFTSLGNNMRVISFMTLAEKYMQEGHTFENNPRLFKDLATMLNTETGRGKQNEAAQKISAYLTKGIWSPKLMASRLNILGISDFIGLFTGYKLGTKGYYKELSPKIREQAIYDLGKFITAVTAITYSFAYAFGGEVDDDPASQTFLDVKVGDKSYNFTGGFSQYIRLVEQTRRGGKTIDGKFKSFEDQRKDRGTNVLHFLRGKVTPVTGVAINAFVGKDYMGQPVTIESEVKKLTIPLSMQSLSSAMERDGSAGLLNTTLPSFIGIGVKDERDYETGDKFTGDEKRNTSLKRLAEYNVDIPKLQTREQVKIKVDKKHKEAGKYKDGSPYALYSEEEFKEYNTMRKDLIIGALDKLFLNLDKKQIKLDQKSLYDALEDIKKKATVLSRMKVLGETEEQEKEDNEIDIEEIISDYFEDKTP